MATVTVDTSDLEKIADALGEARQFFERRDEMNAAVHLGSPRYSPLTARVQAEHERAVQLLGPPADGIDRRVEPRTPLLSEQQPS